MYIIVDIDTGEVYSKKDTENLILKTIKYEHSTEKRIRPDGSKAVIHQTIRVVKKNGEQKTLF